MAVLYHLRGQIKRWAGWRTRRRAAIPVPIGTSNHPWFQEEGRLFELRAILDLSVERCEEIRAVEIGQLEASEKSMRATLERLPQDGDLYQHLRSCAQLIARQQRACSPDSLLRRRLLACPRQLLEHFERFPHELETFKFICQRQGDLCEDELQDCESTFALAVLYQMLQRLRQALYVSSLLSHQDDKATGNLELPLADMELSVALFPEPTSLKHQALARRELLQWSRPSGKSIVRGRINRGYQRLPQLHPDDPVALVHSRGALSFYSADAPLYDIDVSLLTGDDSSFPHSECPAARVAYDAEVSGCIYTDRNRRSRAVSYHPETDRLQLNI